MADVNRAPGMRRVGLGCCVGHHGEILQGVFCKPAQPSCGPYEPGLITLPCRLFWSRARFEADDAFCDRRVEVTPPGKEKARRAAVLTLQQFQLPAGGRLEIVSNIPPARGLGSSTADVVAAVRAVADCHCLRLDAGAVARLAVLAEAASDAVMYADGPRSRAVLFAQRAGRIIETFDGPLPPLVVLGFDVADIAGDGLHAGVDTLRLPLPAYTSAEIAEFERLRNLARQAISTADARSIGQVATRSAVINQAYLPTPGFGDWLCVGQRTGAVGVQVAHSGTVAGLLYDPRETGLSERVSCARRHLLRLGVRRAWRYALS